MKKKSRIRKAIYSHLFKIKSELFAFCPYLCKNAERFALGNLKAHNIYFHCTDPGVSSRYYFQNQIHTTESFGLSERVNSHFTLVGYVNPQHQHLEIIQKWRKIFEHVGWHHLKTQKETQWYNTSCEFCSQNSYSRKKTPFHGWWKFVKIRFAEETI